MNERLIKIIIVLIFFAVILSAFGGFFQEWGNKARDDKCRTSVTKTGVLVKIGDFTEDSTSVLGKKILNSKLNDKPLLDCPVDEIELGKKDEVSKEVLAEELSDCWWMFDKGETKLFPGTGTFCSVCNIITFEEDKGSLTGIMPYLAKNIKKGSDVTYYEYLTSQDIDESDVTAQIHTLENQNYINTLSKDKAYGIFFIQSYFDADDSVAKEFFNRAKWILVGPAIAYFIPTLKDRQEVSFVTMLEYNKENINKLCDYIPTSLVET